MSNYRNLEDIKNELTKRLNNSRNNLALWQSVKRLTKKDGGNFAILNKNLEGAKVEQEYSSVYLKAATYYLPEAERKNIPMTSEEIYIAYRDDELTPEIVFEKIAKRIEQLKQHITECENELVAVEYIFEKYNEKLAVFYQELKTDCEQFRDDTGHRCLLEYMIEDYAKNYYVRA